MIIVFFAILLISRLGRRTAAGRPALGPRRLERLVERRRPFGGGWRWRLRRRRRRLRRRLRRVRRRPQRRRRRRRELVSLRSGYRAMHGTDMAHYLMTRRTAARLVILTLAALPLTGCSYNTLRQPGRGDQGAVGAGAEPAAAAQRPDSESGRDREGLRRARGGRVQGHRRRAVAAAGGDDRPKKPFRPRTSRRARSAGCSRLSRTIRSSGPTNSSTG